MTEQGGDLRVTADANLNPTPFVHLSVDSDGERGLLGVAYDPSFSTNRSVYVYYTVTGSPSHNRVTRFTADPEGLLAVAGSETPIFDIDSLGGATNHNGGAIHFGQDGKLYVAVGDNADGTNSQSLTNARKDPPHQQGRDDPNRQPVLQPGNRGQPRDLGAGPAQSVHLRVPAGHGPSLHQ